MMNTPTLREAFEAYFAESRRNKGPSKRPTFALLFDGTYADDHTQRHWWTWQQALAAPPAPDAQPVVWRYREGPDAPRSRIMDGKPGPWTYREEAEKPYCAWDGVEFEPLYAAPIAQQAPCIGADALCPCQDGDACHYRDAGATKAFPIAQQAAPARQPMTDEQLRNIAQSLTPADFVDLAPS